MYKCDEFLVGVGGEMEMIYLQGSRMSERSTTTISFFTKSCMYASHDDVKWGTIGRPNKLCITQNLGSCSMAALLSPSFCTESTE